MYTTLAFNYKDFKATNYKDEVYHFLAETGDRRTALFNKLTNIQNELISEFGKESKELNQFWDADLKLIVDKL